MQVQRRDRILNTPRYNLDNSPTTGQSWTDSLDHISHSMNTSKCIPNITSNDIPKGTPNGNTKESQKATTEGSPNGNPDGNLKGIRRSEIITNKPTENFTDNLIDDWESKQTAGLSYESDQSYDVPSSSISGNDQNVSNNDRLEFPPVCTIDSNEMFTNQAESLGKFYIKVCIKFKYTSLKYIPMDI